MTTLIDRDRIASTYSLIRPHLRATPVLTVDGGDFGLAGVPLTLKLELFQHAGSFKTRGAFANLLARSLPAAGVVAASGGNHGAAVAYAAMRRNVPAKIFVPTVSSPAKVQRIRDTGAELVVGGERYPDALRASREWAAQSGALAVHAFDQVETLLGQGTLALELEAQAPALDTVLVPVGGGGLLGGIAAWYRRKVRIVGVEPDGAPTLTAALAAGRPVESAVGSIAADSLAAGMAGELAFSIAQELALRTTLVSDDDIRRAQRALWTALRIATEPGAATALAALLSGAYRPAPGERVGVVITGGNTAAFDFAASPA